jgi:hypothetical protein
VACAKTSAAPKRSDAADRNMKLTFMLPAYTEVNPSCEY